MRFPLLMSDRAARGAMLAEAGHGRDKLETSAGTQEAELEDWCNHLRFWMNSIAANNMTNPGR